MSWPRRMIVRASPWCTLWRHDSRCDCKRLRLAPWIVITSDEFWNNREEGP
jgi:hypothetical protein